MCFAQYLVSVQHHLDIVFIKLYLIIYGRTNIFWHLVYFKGKYTFK